MAVKLPVLDNTVHTTEPSRSVKSDVHLKPAKRKLVFRFGRLAQGMPVLLLAASGSMAGCYVHHRVEPERDAGVDARDARPRDSRPIDFGPPDSALCFGEEIFEVEIPAPGTPADATQICLAPDFDVYSGDSARVVLQFDDPSDPRMARGTITIAPDLRADLVGLPTVEIRPGGGFVFFFASAILGPVELRGDEFTFEVTFEGFPFGDPPRDERAEFDVTFELACPDGTSKQVRSTTVVHLCLEDDRTLSFASSGEECRACAIIAEMAPTPIIPTDQPDALPLQQGMELRLRAIARFDNAVVLLAEHGEGEQGVDYDWHASVGRIQLLERDVALWELPESIHDTDCVQVVVETPSAAAVATYRRTVQ